MIEVFIPRWHPAPLNKLLGHWAKAARLKKSDRSIVWAYTRGLPKAEGKRRVELTIVLAPGKRACDPDSQQKSCLDALTHAGMLINDDRFHVELAPVQYERSEDWGTRIVLEDI